MFIEMTQDEIYKLRAMLCKFSTRAILSNDVDSIREIDEQISIIDTRYNDACKRLDDIE